MSSTTDCKTDVYFGNGILTKQGTASDNSEIVRNSIIKKFGYSYYKKNIGGVYYAYNATNGSISDTLESMLQKFGWFALRDAFGDVHGVDLGRQITQYENSINKGNKVLVVAHSQGNLFAHEAYNKLPLARSTSPLV